MSFNVYVLGLDEVNEEALRGLGGSYRFHPLLSTEELVESERIDVEELLTKAEKQLASVDEQVDAIIGYWDFPTSCLVPVLCGRFGLPTTSLRAVVTCEHKYWSRLEQRKVTEAVPAFGIVRLDGEAKPPDGVDFPMWLKPVKSFSSDLAFRVEDRTEFDAALAAISEGIGRIGKPFDYLLGFLDLPDEIAEIGGEAVLAESAIGGEQVTVEGYASGGEVHVQGVIDSVNYQGTSSFLCYRYPAELPERILDELRSTTEKVISQIGLDNSTFNVEYFWDRDTGSITVLEVNPRLSQSHARLFHAVDGAPNHQCMVRLALGEDPELPWRAGQHRVAGKYFLRRFLDGVVTRVPTSEEIERLEHDEPGVSVAVVVEEGDRLSELPSQDSYSYELADLFIGAEDQRELDRTYERCVERLRFEFDDDVASQES